MNDIQDKTFTYLKQISRIYRELWQDKKNTITRIPATLGKRYVEQGFEPTEGALKDCNRMKMCSNLLMIGEMQIKQSFISIRVMEIRKRGLRICFQV